MTLHELTALEVSRFLSRAGARLRPVTTSVTWLSVSTGYCHDSIRAALEVLCRYQAIDIELLDGTTADPERLRATTTFVVVSLDFHEVPPAPKD